jgi:hypothetical protein
MSHTDRLRITLGRNRGFGLVEMEDDDDRSVRGGFCLCIDFIVIGRTRMSLVQ